MKRHQLPIVGGVLFVLVNGCGSTAGPADGAVAVNDGAASGGGRIQIFLQAEDTITDGLTPGAGEENIVDGWTVTYTKFLANVGHVHLRRTVDSVEVHEHSETVFDLTQTPQNGFPIVDRSGVAAGRYDEIEFETPIVTATTTRHMSVTETDFARMVTEGCTYLIAGELTNPTGQTCLPGTRTCTPRTSVMFDLCLSAETTFGPCSNPDGMAGIAVSDGTTATGAVTLHGDHLFFNSFPTGDEAVVERRAQWLADSDIDGNGMVNRDELAMTMASRLFVAPNYSLAGAPMVDGMPVNTALDFARAQVKTQGHWNGEGECPVDSLGSHSH